jgi:hypothetical protein
MISAFTCFGGYGWQHAGNGATRFHVSFLLIYSAFTFRFLFNEDSPLMRVGSGGSGTIFGLEL